MMELIKAVALPYEEYVDAWHQPQFLRHAAENLDLGVFRCTTNVDRQTPNVERRTVSSDGRRIPPWKS